MLQKESDDRKAALEQKEFDDSKAANIRAVELMIEKPRLKVIDLVETLLEQNPGLPLTVQDGNRQLRIVSVTVDFIKGVQLHVSSPAESRPADGQDRGDCRRSGDEKE